MNSKEMSEGNNIDSLIGDLTSELKPVKPMVSPLLYIIPWILSAVAFAACSVFFIGVRHDVDMLYLNAPYLFEMALMTSIGIFSALTSAYLSIPDMGGKKWLLPVTNTLIATFIGWTIIRGVTEGAYMPHLHLDHCMGEGGFIAIIPIAILIFMMRQGATTRPITMAMMNVMSIAAIGYVSLRFTCSMDTVAHATLSHLFPYTVLGAVIGLVARKLYKW